MSPDGTWPSEQQAGVPAADTDTPDTPHAPQEEEAVAATPPVVTLDDEFDEVSWVQAAVEKGEIEHHTSFLSTGFKDHMGAARRALSRGHRATVTIGPSVPRQAHLHSDAVAQVVDNMDSMVFTSSIVTHSTFVNETDLAGVQGPKLAHAPPACEVEGEPEPSPTMPLTASPSAGETPVGGAADKGAPLSDATPPLAGAMVTKSSEPCVSSTPDGDLLTAGTLALVAMDDVGLEALAPSEDELDAVRSGHDIIHREAQ